MSDPVPTEVEVTEAVVDAPSVNPLTKNIMTLLLTVFTAFITPSVVNEVADTTPTPAIALDIPTECVVGELVRLNYPARRVEWKLPGFDHHIDENRAWISFRQPGTYQIIASGLVDNDVQLVAESILVKGDVSVLVPEPLPDVVIDDVIPDDVPVPVPDNLDKFGLADEVVEWCRKANTPPEVAKSLGDNFIEAATNATNTPDLMTGVAALNRATEQGGAEQVLVNIQIWMIDNLTGGSFDDHQCAFSEIGDGFLQYSEGE